MCMIYINLYIVIFLIFTKRVSLAVKNEMHTVQLDFPIYDVECSFDRPSEIFDY
jgi:hypothetical protein